MTQERDWLEAGEKLLEQFPPEIKATLIKHEVD
jgi:hypothetical protein